MHIELHVFFPHPKLVFHSSLFSIRSLRFFTAPWIVDYKEIVFGRLYIRIRISAMLTNNSLGVFLLFAGARNTLFLALAVDCSCETLSWSDLRADSTSLKPSRSTKAIMITKNVETDKNKRSHLHHWAVHVKPYVSYYGRRLQCAWLVLFLKELARPVRFICHRDYSRGTYGRSFLGISVPPRRQGISRNFV